MGSTIVEKILARAAGQRAVKAGQNVQVEPDLVSMYDWEGISDYIFGVVEKELGKRVDGRKLILFIDHKVPATTPQERAFHLETIKWAKEHNVRIYPEGMGISLHLLAELGLVNPGDVVVHTDRHVNLLGGLCVFSVGTRLEVIMSLATGKFNIKVPETVRVNLQGHFRPGVMGRDLIHRIVGDMGPDGAMEQVLEFGGPASANVSMDSRLSICCMAMFTGATTAIFGTDTITRKYFQDNFLREVDVPDVDRNCEYAKILNYNLSELEPQIVVPPKPQNTAPLGESEGTLVQQGYIGSCASGRLEDLSVAAQILEGRNVAEGFRLFIVPSSNKVMAEAARLGYLENLLKAGAWISSPTCDYCYGKTQNLGDEEIAISTGPLNVPGRMGNVNADIYLASAASVAAAAINGVIADPRNFL